eukprot:1977219-Pyramimonas_sp.AAC.1
MGTLPKTAPRKRSPPGVRAQYMTTTTKIDNNLRCDLVQFCSGEKPVAPLPPPTGRGLLPLS